MVIIRTISSSQILASVKHQNSSCLYFFFHLSAVVHYQCFDGHGVPLVSVFRCSYHFCFFYFHPNTEALCIGNSLSSSATLSLNFSTYAKVFYFCISHNMSKEAHLSPSYSNYQIPFCCHSIQDFFIHFVFFV